MTITELIRSIGEKVFLFFIALCLVGVFSSISFAEEATTNKPAPETQAEGTPPSTPPGKIERAGQAAGKGIERGANATERGVRRAGEGIERAGEATKRGVKRAGEATGKGIKKAGEAIEKTFSDKD